MDELNHGKFTTCAGVFAFFEADWL